ncbi:MAG: SHOCT domain-containing protein, partial [Planctomycetaceae bacterium]|nr:SHOCT domain-containing protein [Planctomycetaceae bacterium]
YDEIGMDAIAKLRNAQADRGVMDTLGEDWGRQQAANILGTLASNPGSGGIAAAGAGLGMGIGAGGIFAGMAQQMFSPLQPTAPAPTPPGPTGRFTQRPADGGMPPQGNANDLAARLRNLQELLNQGLISQAEYDSRRAEIINQI